MIQKPHCGECSFFLCEDISGYGWCEIRRREQRCDDECSLKYTDSETEDILHHYQKWRRGGKAPQPKPYIVGRAIDQAIRVLRAKRKQND
jgi:hypothetical protein